MVNNLGSTSPYSYNPYADEQAQQLDSELQLAIQLSLENSSDGQSYACSSGASSSDAMPSMTYTVEERTAAEYFESLSKRITVKPPTKAEQPDDCPVASSSSAHCVDDNSLLSGLASLTLDQRKKTIVKKGAVGAQARSIRNLEGVASSSSNSAPNAQSSSDAKSRRATRVQEQLLRNVERDALFSLGNDSNKKGFLQEASSSDAQAFYSEASSSNAQASSSNALAFYSDEEASSSDANVFSPGGFDENWFNNTPMPKKQELPKFTQMDFRPLSDDENCVNDPIGFEECAFDDDADEGEGNLAFQDKESKAFKAMLAEIYGIQNE